MTYSITTLMISEPEKSYTRALFNIEEPFLNESLTNQIIHQVDMSLTETKLIGRGL